MLFVNQTSLEKLELPDRVYKYRVWENQDHKKIITESQIYFSAPFDMDENHECNLPTDFDSVTREVVYNYAKYRAPDFGIFDPEQIEAFAEYTLRTTSAFDEEHIRRSDEIFRQTVNKQLSIFSVSEHKDNYNLWSCFGGGNTGFCVGINTRKMFENKETFGGGGKIRYYPIDNPPKRKPFVNSEIEMINEMLNVFLSLPNFFEKEKEYRLFKMNITNKKVHILSDSIEEIILGSHMTSKNKREIIDEAKIKLPKAKITQANFNFHTGVYTFSNI